MNLLNSLTNENKWESLLLKWNNINPSLDKYLIHYNVWYPWDLKFILKKKYQIMHGLMVKASIKDLDCLSLNSFTWVK